MDWPLPTKQESNWLESDTIYACQDKRDDVKAGVKSTAILFGAYIKPILTAFASALVVSLWVAGQLNNMGIYYKAISVGGGALYLAIDMLTVDLDSPKSCWASVRLSSSGPHCIFKLTLRIVPPKWFPIWWPRVGWCSGRLHRLFVILQRLHAAVCRNVRVRRAVTYLYAISKSLTSQIVTSMKNYGHFFDKSSFVAQHPEPKILHATSLEYIHACYNLIIAFGSVSIQCCGVEYQPKGQ